MERSDEEKIGLSTRELLPDTINFLRLEGAERRMGPVVYDIDLPFRDPVLFNDILLRGPGDRDQPIGLPRIPWEKSSVKGPLKIRHIPGIVLEIQIVDHPELWDIRSQGQKSIGGNEKIGTELP